MQGKTTPWGAIVEGLECEGVEYVFGLPGSPQLLYDDLFDRPAVKPVLVRHETAAVFMAMAYSRTTGHPGVVHACPGPGMANLIAGLLEAESSCAPIVALVSGGARAHADMGGFQDAPQLEMVRPIVKWASRIEQPERTTWHLRRAFSIVQNGKPGPVYLEVPVDIARQKVEMPAYRPAVTGLRPAVDQRRIEAAADILAAAERPVIVAGGGVGLSGAEAELEQLANTLNAPVLTTPQGRGSLEEDHRLSFGLIGFYRTESSARAYDEADVLLMIGTRMEELQTGAWKLVPERAKLLHIDIDAYEIDRNLAPDIAMVGDARLAIEQLLEALDHRPAPPVSRTAAVDDLVRFKTDYEARLVVECAPVGEQLKTKQILQALPRVFGDYVLVSEVGGQDSWSYFHPYSKAPLRRGFFSAAEQGCMSSGVTGAIGAKLGMPSAPVICVTGDGSFQMGMKEISTAVQYQAPVLWIVLNNASLHWNVWIQHRLGDRHIGQRFDAMPDLVGIAHAHGAHGERIDSPTELDAALTRAKDAIASGVPAVLDCIIDTWDYADGFVSFQEEYWTH